MTTGLTMAVTTLAQPLEDSADSLRDTIHEINRATRQLEKDTSEQAQDLRQDINTAFKKMQKDNNANFKQLRKDIDENLRKAFDQSWSNK